MALPSIGGIELRHGAEAAMRRTGARSLRGPRGASLLELLVASAIAAALLLLAAAGHRAWIADLEQRDRVEAMAAAMSLARSEAIKRNLRVNLCPSSDGAHCAPGGRWEAGFIVFADTNGDGDRDDSEAIVHVTGPAYPGIVVAANKPVADYVSYTAFGHTRMVNGALQMGTFTVCRPGNRAVAVVLANGGRVRVERLKTACS
jgi:type IV fimbrial biogenesis protein FimT